MSRREKTAGARLRDDQGATAVEFALIVPLVIFIVAYGLSFASMLWHAAELNRVAELTARAVALPSLAAIDGRSYRSLDQVRSDVEASFNDRFDAITVSDAQGSPIDPTQLREGEAFTVTVTRQWNNPLAGLITPIAGSGGPTSDTLEAQHTGVRE